MRNIIKYPTIRTSDAAGSWELIAVLRMTITILSRFTDTDQFDMLQERKNFPFSYWR